MLLVFQCFLYALHVDTTGTRSAANGKLFLLRYGAAQPDISIVNNGMQIDSSDFTTLPSK